MTYKFQGCAYRLQEEMLDAIAYEWLSGDGLISEPWQRHLLAIKSDQVLADACIAGLNLDVGAPNGYGEELPSHMEEYGYGEEELAEAFARLRGALCGGDVTQVA